MKPKKKILFLILATLIIARIAIMMFESHEDYKKVESIKNAAPTQAIDSSTVDPNLSGTPPEAMTQHNPIPPNQNTLCESMREHYQRLDEVKKTEKVSVRFVNVHKKVDGEVFRTRFFYKDSSEQEIPTFLLYQENNEDEPVLIESTPYKKGPQYLRIEKALGEVLHTEEGVNIGTKEDLFLHFENKVLKNLQGHALNDSGKNFIECSF